VFPLNRLYRCLRIWPLVFHAFKKKLNETNGSIFLPHKDKFYKEICILFSDVLTFLFQDELKTEVSLKVFGIDTTKKLLFNLY